MAITPVSNRYPGFIFAGENSRTYGVYITSPAVFNAPERDAELVPIPGRNGDYVLDRGRWKNITVTYNCALPAESPADFIQGVQDFRNMLASKVGYQRLSDEINTDEYREGAFITGLDVDNLNPEAGTFAVMFTCKPQRFLTSGETAIEVQDGDTITNPTLFDSRPMLEVDGYGAIDLNGETLTILNEQIGRVLLKGAGAPVSYRANFDTNAVALLESGDTITLTAGTSIFIEIVAPSYPTIILNGLTVTPTGAPSWHVEYVSIPVSGNKAQFRAVIDEDLTFTNGTSDSVSGTIHGTVTIPYTDSGTAKTYTGTFSGVGLTYGAGDPQYIAVKNGLNMITPKSIVDLKPNSAASTISDIYGMSTRSTVTDTVLIDLDIGEAYTDINGTLASVNNVVSIPAQLPALKPGSNTINFDPTITQLKIVPRWWRL